MNSYLTIAAKVLHEARQPLSASQILKAAYQLQIVPSNLYGKTQYKTLHARLAEDILRRRNKSMFIRTEPGRFFLRSLLHDRTILARFKKEYIAPLRAYQLQHFHVLCLDRSTLETAQRMHGSVIALDRVQPLPIRYEILSNVRKGGELLIVRIFVVVHTENNFLLRRGWFSTEDNISGEASVGLMGYVKREDKTLFSQDRYGIREAAFRTLSEQLHWSQDEIERLRVSNERGTYIIVDVNNQELGESAAIVVMFRCATEVDRLGRPSDPLAFQWYPLASRVNDEDQFDPWSQYILRSGLLPKPIAA